MRFRLILIVVVILVTALLLGLVYLFLQSERERDQLAQDITATAAMQNTIAAYSPTPSETPTPTPTFTPSPTDLPTDTPAPSATPTDAATQTPTPTDTAEASATPLPFEIGLQIFGDNRRQPVLKAESLSPSDEASYVLIDGGQPNDDPARVFIQPNSRANFDENDGQNLNIRLEDSSDIFLMAGSYGAGAIEIVAALNPPISLEVGSACAGVSMTSQEVSFACYGREGQTCAYRDENGAAIRIEAGELVLLSLDERRVMAQSESIPYSLTADYYDLMRELVTVEADNCLMPYLDQDGDGFIDEEDNCPSEFGEINGCPDSDGDGIPDNLDLCPDQFGSAALQGCPDTDGDGVADELDLCPLLFGRAEYFGCPQRPAFDTATPTATLLVPTATPTETPFIPEQPTPFPGEFPTPFPIPTLPGNY